MHKYVRTPHLEGSKFQHGDHDMDAVPFRELQGKHLVVEEKIDGANVGISFEASELRLQSRGHFLRGGPREKQFELLKQWAATHEMSLYELLGDRYVMYGEWMFACHTIWYDQLPHYFMEFDVLDKETGEFLSTPARDNLLRHDKAPVEIVPVRVLAAGVVKSTRELETMVGQSAFINCDDHWAFCRDWTGIEGNVYVSKEPSPEHRWTWGRAAEKSGYFKYSSSIDPWLSPEEKIKYDEASKKFYVGPTMEGLYIKWEENGTVKGRYKFVRGDFTSHLAGQEEHWHDRPILQNQLAKGALERMFATKEL